MFTFILDEVRSLFLHNLPFIKHSSQRAWLSFSLYMHTCIGSFTYTLYLKTMWHLEEQLCDKEFVCI